MTCRSSCKIVFLGNSESGKSSIISTILNTKPRNEITIGCDLSTHDTVGPDGCVTCMQFWDTGGSERFRSLCLMYARSSAVAVVVADGTKGVTTTRGVFRDWTSGLETICQQRAFYVINKIDDLDADALRVLREAFPSCVFVSAVTGEGISELFAELKGVAVTTHKHIIPSVQRARCF